MGILAAYAAVPGPARPGPPMASTSLCAALSIPGARLVMRAPNTLLILSVLPPILVLCLYCLPLQYDIDPLQLPQGLDEELEALDDLGAEGDLDLSNLGDLGIEDSDEEEGAGASGRGGAGRRGGAEAAAAAERAAAVNKAAQEAAKASRVWGSGLLRKYSADEFKRTFPSRGSEE